MIKAKLTGTSGAINSQLDSNEQHLEASLEKSTTQYVGGNGINIDNGIVSNTGVTSINGQTGDLDGFALTAEIPTKTSQLTNDSQFITNTVSNLTNYYKKTETYTQTEVNNLIGSMSSISFQVVDNLSSTGEDNLIYLIADSQSTNNIYKEYIWVNNAWELIGNTSVDLSNYYTKTETDSTFLEKVTTTASFDRFYAVTTGGQQTMLTASANAATPSSIAKRTTGGQLVCNTPASSSHATTKAYVDDLMDTKADTNDIPTKTSDLTNDSGFITEADIATSNGSVNRTNTLLATWDIAEFVENNPDATSVSFSYTGETEYDELWLKCSALKGSATGTSGFTAIINGVTTNTQIISYTNGTNGGSAFTKLTLCPYGTMIEKTGASNSPTNYAYSGIQSPYNISCTNTEKFTSLSCSSNPSYPVISGVIYLYGVIYVAKGEKGDKGDAGTTDYNNLTNKPTIPTKTSDLTNDSDFQNATQVQALIDTAIANITDGDEVNY